MVCNKSARQRAAAGWPWGGQAWQLAAVRRCAEALAASIGAEVGGLQKGREVVGNGAGVAALVRHTRNN